MTDIPTMRRILRENHSIAVVGLSSKWHRPSNFAAKYLIDHGYEVIPVNPGETEVLGQRCYADLLEVPARVDVVDIFRRPEEVPALVDQAIEIGARVVWMQIGVVHEEAAAKARAAGLDVVMDRCMKIEYARLFGGLNFVGVNTGVVSSHRSRYVPY
ncbi:CoA-binding protein [Ectothiorhodospiraceae bacterium WFHF3C12]|nr:CoA-binding protein [Ectothiorhodospiraceae bacterium WFHF3C12]